MKSAIRAVVVNAVAIALLYLVTLDLDWRSSCAAIVPPGCRASIASISYWPFFMVYQVVENGVLKSPPTLDWPQVLLAFLVVFDLFYVYQSVRGRSNSKLRPDS